MPRSHPETASLKNASAMGCKASDDAPLPRGQYANYFEVGHNTFEFVLDFGQAYSDRKPHLHTRIILGPIVARSLLALLRQSLENFDRPIT
jgi:hypothetical protein